MPYPKVQFDYIGHHQVKDILSDHLKTKQIVNFQGLCACVHCHPFKPSELRGPSGPRTPGRSNLNPPEPPWRPIQRPRSTLAACGKCSRPPRSTPTAVLGPWSAFQTGPRSGVGQWVQRAGRFLRKQAWNGGVEPLNYGPTYGLHVCVLIFGLGNITSMWMFPTHSSVESHCLRSLFCHACPGWGFRSSQRLKTGGVET